MSEDAEIFPTAEQQATDRVVHALLLHINDDDAVRQQRVARVMESIAIGESLPNSEGRRLRISNWRRPGALAAAASVLIGFAILIFISSPTPVMASLSDILISLSRPGDRTFRIRVEPPAPDSVSPRPGLNNATLYLRNSNQYVLTRNSSRGDAFDGFDGNQSWRVRHGSLVEEKEGLGAGRIPMPQSMSDVSFADLQSELAQMNAGYVIDRFDKAPVPGQANSLAHVLAHRKSQEVKGPQTIEIWADPKTGVPQRIVFDKAKFQGSADPRRLTFELVSENPLSSDWFKPSAHEATN